ncbi:hypothetical protein ACHAWF_010764 [Thalassiosira exigua]
MSLVLALLALLFPNSGLVVTAWTAAPLNLKGRFFRDRSHQQQHLRCPPSRSHHDDRYPGGEVVGSTGKIGSYILDRLNAPIAPIQSNDDASGPQYPQSLHAAAVPRGLAPGCLSPDGAPIYACIPSSSIAAVWDSTLPHRRKDLVFLCNCVPSRHLTFDGDVDVTIAILHFGVSHSRTAYSDAPSIPMPRLNASPQSPPTVIYGPHASSLAGLLQRDSIPVRVEHDARAIQVAAAKKLAWSGVMWLLCHGADDGGQPMTVKEVHQTHPTQLQRIVVEIRPAMNVIASENWINKVHPEQDTGNAAKLASRSVGSVQEILEYLQMYSMSVSNGEVIPGRDLALREIQDRNGLLLSLERTHCNAGDGESKTYHADLIRRVAGEKVLANCLEKNLTYYGSRSEHFTRIQCATSDLEFLFRSSKSAVTRPDHVKSAIVVGAGILGSSIALSLSMRGVKVTVMDERTNLLPPGNHSSGDHDIDPGTATSSSFAWLNSNDKSPLACKQFNHLGMEVWRRHTALKQIPVWCGSLVRKVKLICDEAGKANRYSPYYLHAGPIDREESCSLEPGVDWSSSVSGDESEVHFYPEEGHVDPIEAVKKLRLDAQGNGVTFLEGAHVKNLVRDKNSSIIGVDYAMSRVRKDGSESAEHVSTAEADIVVVSAGANSAHPTLGIGPKNLKLLEQPGVLAYAVGGDADDSDRDPLKRIFVDTIAQTHALCRTDNTIVIGGGKLIVGGNGDKRGVSGSVEGTGSASASAHTPIEEDVRIWSAMVEAAATSIAPFGLQKNLPHSPNQRKLVSRANRPMPSDGLPVIGFVDQGLYVAVMHSGITLGPLVGDLAAHEICAKENDEGFQILDQYRPSRYITQH